MKRLIAIALVVALVVTALSVAVPVFAKGGGKGPAGGNRVVFSADFTDLTSVVPGWDEFKCGKVRVRENGELKIVIRGAPAGRTYQVLLGSAVPDGTYAYDFLGVMTEYNNGRYKFETTLSSPPFAPLIASASFVIFDEDRPFPDPPQFTTGFALPSTPP